MFQFRTLFALIVLSTTFSTPSVGTPVKNGESVGKVQIIKQKLHVTNKDLYPYIVHLYISHIVNGQRSGGHCGGVIVGRRTVLTAAHCLKSRVQPIVTVHAGILDLDHEEFKGQKIKMKEFMVHPEYKTVCRAPDRIRCCYEMNDIAIVWLEEHFEFGPYVQRAKLNRNVEKPINQKGLILGWGYNNQNKLSKMLQRGEVEVISQKECDRYNPRVHVTEKMLCLKPGRKGAKSVEGDSGGPFEINGVVYGISSQSIFKEPVTCLSEEINIYTDVAQYFNWLDKNLRAGPPSDRPPSPQGHRPSSPQRKFLN